MTNGVTPVDPLKPRRRMLPSVSDVVHELGLTTTADPPTLFRVARQVCAEELNRVKQGLESEPLEVLAARAEKLLDPSQIKPRPAAPPESASSEDPFAETAAMMDLKWTAEAKEPFGDAMPPAETPAPHSPPGDLEASTARVEPLFPPEPFDMKTEIAEPPEFGMEAPLAGTAEPMPVPAPQPVRSLIDEDGPGEATLDRLSRDAQAVDLASVLPREPPVDDAAPPPAYMDSSLEPSRRDTTLPGFAKAPRTRSSWPWLLAAVVVLGAGAFVLLRGRSGGTGTAPSPERSRAEEPTAAATSAASAPEPTAVVVTAPAFQTPVPSSASSRESKKAEKLAKAEKAEKAEKAAKAEKPEPTAAAPVPVVRDAPASGLPVSRGAQMLTPDWTSSAIWVVHVGSYKDRPSAEREAAQLAKQTGKPAHAFEVNLGEKGTWYRSAVGEFASADEAGAYKAELAKLVPRVGLVYKVSAAK